MTDPGAVDDAELVAAMAAGDEAALDELYTRHAPWLSIRLTRRCNDDDTVAEVLQDTFLGVWRNAASWRGDGEVAAWLWGIAIRKLITHFRRAGRGRAATPAPLPDRPSESAEDLVLLSVEYGDLGAALAALSPDLRAVVQLTLLDGLTVREAAQALDLPLGTAKGRIRKAKSEIRNSLVNTSGMKEGWL